MDFGTVLPKNGRNLLALLAAAAVGLASCESAPQPELTGPAVRASSGGSGATLEVTVLTSTGDPAPGLLVVPFNTATGPFQSGAYTSRFTDPTGLATFSGLSSGRYCVTVRDLPADALHFLGGIVPPPSGMTPTANNGNTVAVVTGTQLATVPLTKSTFTTYCTTSQAPLSIKNGKSKLTITLLDPSATPPGSVSWLVRTLDGGYQDLPAWTVLDLPLPWFAGQSLPQDVKPGLLVATTATGGTAGGLSTADFVAVQTALEPGSGDQGLLTATLHVKPQTGTVTPTTVYAEPLACVVDRSSTENFGDASGTLDIAGLGADSSIMKVGFGANGDLTLDASTFSLWHLVRGTGTLTLQIRFNGGPVSNIQQDLNLLGGTGWSVGATRGSGSGTVVVTPFVIPFGDSLYRVTWLVTGLDPAVTSVDLQLSASGDKWPDASRDNQVSGYFRLYEPTTGCTGGQGSDDRFWAN